LNSDYCKKGKMTMKKSVIMCMVAAMVIGLLGYGKLFAEPKAAMGPTKIGLVSVRSIFQNCKKNTDWKTKMTAEQEKVFAELKKVDADIKAIQADLETRKVGTDDYLKLTKDISEKKGYLDGQQQYYREYFKQKDQIWTEKTYVEILDAVGKIAKQKGYDLVLEKDEIELPAASATELMLIIRTHKVLYYNEDMDFTSDVLAAVDAQQAGTTGDSNVPKAAK
jgi:Skp family chaperone for outer membrane proteins